MHQLLDSRNLVTLKDGDSSKSRNLSPANKFYRNSKFAKLRWRETTEVIIRYAQGARKDGRGNEPVGSCAMCDARSIGPRALEVKNR